MAEEYKKSRFKRKKLLTDPCLTELATYHRSSESCEVTNWAAVHAQEWWIRNDLSGVERLWTFPLKSALQCFESGSWGPVPDLPATSITPRKPKPSEWRWCSLSEEVIPYPEPSPCPCPPVGFPSPPPDSPHLSPSLERTRAAPAESTKTLSTLGLLTHAPCQQYLTREGTCSTGQGHASRDNGSKEQGPKTTLKVSSDQKDDMAKTRPPTLQNNTVQARSASLLERDRHPSTPQLMRGLLPESKSDEKKVEEEKEQGSVIKRQLPAHQGEASDSHTASPRVEEIRRKEEEGVVVSGSCGVDPGRGTGSEEAAAGGGGIQSCPMCLVVFPAGFTQMDCDGHLAQCLSDMNVDMSW